MSKEKNENLHKAKRAKKDEFYTQLGDIENELKHYREHFKDKVIFCNCDDPLVSNFFKYFFLNFKFLGLKKLICTCYKSQDMTQISHQDSPQNAATLKIDRINLATAETLLSLSRSQKQSQKTLKNFEKNKHKLQELLEKLPADSKTHIQTTLFDIDEDKDLGNAGDFRSGACIELLKECDIVVTNPPFSLFREYVAQLMEYGKKFVIIAHQNAISYKEIFKHIKDGKIWLGYGFRGKAGHFISKYKDIATASSHKEGMIRVSGVTWLTNLDIQRLHENLGTEASYYKTPEKYPKYDNYDAINVDKTIEIPLDYEGIMGVPITFLDKHNPKQFEIVGWSRHNDANMDGGYWLGGKADATINGKEVYRRILIKNLNPKRS